MPDETWLPANDLAHLPAAVLAMPPGLQAPDGTKCWTCDGTGNMGSEGPESDCPECGGTGLKRTE